MARDDQKDLPHGVVPVAAMFVGGVAARNLAAQGETRPQKALELAARLRRSGASPDTIHAETSKLLAGSPYAGVHYGRDGLPRFEVSDEQARIRPAGLDRSGRGFVGDVVQHPDLYRAHPETQLLEVQKANFTGGGFDGRTLHIGSNHVSKAMLAGRPMVKQSARGVALHEMQHAVQDAEGFAPGASPDDFETRFPGAKNAAVRDQLYITTAGEVEAENTRARRNMTAAQRRATPPSRTETVAVSEQHMGFDEGHTGMARQFGGDLPKGYSVERHTNSMGQTDYKIMHGKKQVGNAYVRDLGNKVQVGRISINEAHQRKGISTALYSQIERDLGKPVSPDDTLSDKAYKFWKKHRPEAVAAHKPTKSGGAIHDPYGLAKMLYADSEYADPETGGVRAGEVRRVQRMVEKSPPAGRTTKAAKPRATKQVATFGFRGTQNAANLAAIVENRKANAQPAVPSRLSNMPTTGTHDIDVRGVTTEYRADAVGDPYKFKSRTHQNVGYGDDGYPKSAIIHANTLDEYEAKVAAAQKAIKDGESAAAKTRAAAEAKATPAKPKAARKAKAVKVEAPKPQAGQTTGQGVAQPTPPAAKLPDTKPASRTDARAAFMASAKAAKLPGGGFEVTAPDGSKMTLPNAGTEAAAKITAFAKLGSAVNKLGAVSMIAVPVAAAYVAYQGTKSQAMAEGRDGTAEAVGQAAVAAGGAAAIGYGMMKAIGGTLSVAAKLAPRIAPALGPVGLGIGVVAMGHGAYKGYQRHGLKGAALGLVGADSVLDAPSAPAAQPQPVQGRLNADQKTQFATANAAYGAMQKANAVEPDGMTQSYTRTLNGKPVQVQGYKTPRR